VGEEEDFLPAIRGERVRAAVEVGEREVGCLERGELRRALARADAEVRRPLRRVEGERTVDERGEACEVDAVRGDERLLAARGDAAGAPAEALGLQLPAERRAEV